MGTVEISINEDGAVKVSQRYSLSALLGEMRSEGLGRHRAADCPSCSSLSKTPSDGGPFLFLALILYSLVTYSSIAFLHSGPHVESPLVQLPPEQFASYRSFPSERSISDFPINQMDLFGRFLLEQTGIRRLDLLVWPVVAVAVVGTLVCLLLHRRRRRRRRADKLQTISALVQQV